jgi:ABC-type sugar transport system ATPase subunit
VTVAGKLDQQSYLNVSPGVPDGRTTLHLDAKLQVDTRRNLYEQRANVFVAGFIGAPAMNLQGAKLVPEGAVLSGTVLPLLTDLVGAAHTAELDEVTIGLRPASGSLSPAGRPDTIALTVRLVEELAVDVASTVRSRKTAPATSPGSSAAAAVRPRASATVSASSCRRPTPTCSHRTGQRFNRAHVGSR